MGGWTRGVYTAEQQQRLGINEDGEAVDVPATLPTGVPLTLAPKKPGIGTVVPVNLYILGSKNKG